MKHHARLPENQLHNRSKESITRVIVSEPLAKFAKNNGTEQSLGQIYMMSTLVIQ